MKKYMKKTMTLVLAGVMSAGLLAGCGEEEAKLDGAKAAATVNGTEIPMGVVSLMTRITQSEQEYYMAKQASTYAQFGYSVGTDIWDETAGDSEETNGQQLVKNTVTNLERMYVEREKAAEYNVELTDEEKTAIADAAAAFMAANKKETLDELSVTEDQVKEFLEIETIAHKMEHALRDEAPVEITDEEANQSSFMYITVDKDVVEEEETVDDNGDAVEDGSEEETAEEETAEDASGETAEEEDADTAEDEEPAPDGEKSAESSSDNNTAGAAEETAEDAVKEVTEEAEGAVKEAEDAVTEAAADAVEETAETAEDAVEEATEETDPAETAEEEEEKPQIPAIEKAQQILDTLKEDPAADMNEAADKVDDTLSAVKGHYTTANTDEDADGIYPQEVIEAARALKEGEVAQELIETDDAYYIVRKEKELDEEETAAKREELDNEKRTQYYLDTVDGWVEAAEITENSDQIKTLVVTDSHKFNMVIPPSEDEEYDESEVEGSEETAEDLEDAVVEDMSETAEDAKETVEDAADEVLEEVSDTADAVKETAEDAADKAADAADKTADKAADTADKAADKAADAAEDAADAVKDAAAND